MMYTTIIRHADTKYLSELSVGLVVAADGFHNFLKDIMNHRKMKKPV